MSGNPWDPTAPMGPRPPAPSGQPPRNAAHWPTPQAPVIPPTGGDESGALPLRQRSWLAALALYLLAPVIAEALTGSTPPMQALNNPLSLVYLTALYGSGALLARETVRRRGLGWGSLFVLGAAYGALEEGLVVTSWQNRLWPDVAFLHGYSVAYGVNWYWALGMTAFHAIVSVVLPIALVEAAFPALAHAPWLGKRSYRLLLAWLLVASVVGLVGFGFLMFRDQGYHPPLVGYALALAITLALSWLGMHPLGRLLRRAQGDATLPPKVNGRRAPSLGTLRIAGFAFTLLFFVVFWGAPGVLAQPALGVAALVGALTLPTALVMRWSHRLDWSPRRRLALLTGVALFFVALAPALQYVIKPADKDLTGLTPLAVATLAGLICLAYAARAEEQRRLGAPKRVARP